MGWSGGLIDWVEDDTAYISAVFSWQLDKAYMRAIYLQSSGYKVKVGGPAIINNPTIFTAFDLMGSPDALARHNPDATFTSRGCIRKCSFCAVPKIEGRLMELSEWKVKPIICDNNLLACSDAHFDRVIDRLLESGLKGIDFQQGLDARILTDHHALRFAELPKDTLIRLAWEVVVKMENDDYWWRADNVVPGSDPVVYHWQFYKGKKYDSDYEYSLPLAICRAALLATMTEGDLNDTQN